MLSLFCLLFVAVSALPQGPARLQSALSSPAALRQLFTEYESSMGRHYEGTEQRLRINLFRQNIREVVAQNSEGDSWTSEINMFSDMTDEEKFAYTGANATQAPDDIPDWRAPERCPHCPKAPSAGSKDLRKVGRVTKVKNQGSCGSCWVFSAVGALEAAYKNKGSILKSFSEQEGLDCSMRNGCGGGWMQRVYDYSKKAGRLAPMSAVRYRAKEGSCRYSNVKDGLIAFKISGYTNARGDSKHVQALDNGNALSVAYTCTRKFMQYRGGIYRESRCSGGGHAVTNVGYAPDYFIMKNSWGSGFGENGYFRIGRGNVCGITNTGYVPTLSSTGQTDNGTDEGGDDGGDDDDDDDDDDDNNDVCVDDNDRCPEWAARDPSECTENWRWMTSNCRKSCKQCSCVDLHTKCAEWKGKGYCEKEYVSYMNAICRKTCDKCNDDDDDDDNDGECQEGFKKCPDGSCVHEHWNC